MAIYYNIALILKKTCDDFQTGSGGIQYLIYSEFLDIVMNNRYNILSHNESKNIS